jgi:hypothetical protein
MAPKPKNEQKQVLEVELGSGESNLSVEFKNSTLENLKKSVLAGSIWQIITARTQPDATSAIAKVAFAYDLDIRDFVFSDMEMSSIRELSNQNVDIDKILDARYIVRNLNQENN